MWGGGVCGEIGTITVNVLFFYFSCFFVGETGSSARGHPYLVLPFFVVVAKHAGGVAPGRPPPAREPGPVTAGPAAGGPACGSAARWVHHNPLCRHGRLEGFAEAEQMDGEGRSSRRPVVNQDALTSRDTSEPAP